MRASRPSSQNVVAVLVATTAALLVRAWLEIELIEDGLSRQQAADLAYLVVPPILLLLLFPVLRMDRAFLTDRFSLARLTPQVILRAVGVGVAIRALWWASLVTGVSFGIYRNDDPLAIEGPAFAFGCPPTQFLVLGIFVMCMLVPVIEEVTHRAYVQGGLARFGAPVAISASALVFAAFHTPVSWGFTFFAGIVFGVQFWNSASLWPSVISHATVNGLIHLDWHCLTTKWNPRAEQLPLWFTGSIAVAAGLACLVVIYCLVRPKK